MLCSRAFHEQLQAETLSIDTTYALRKKQLETFDSESSNFENAQKYDLRNILNFSGYRSFSCYVATQGRC